MFDYRGVQPYNCSAAMEDFPLLPFTSVSITPISKECGGVSEGVTANGWKGNNVWIATNRAILYQVRLWRLTQIQRMFSMNGVVVSGNMDLGVYTYEGVLIKKTGPQPQTVISQVQSFPLSVQLYPGDYWMAMAMDNVTGMVWRNTSTVASIARTMGVVQANSSFPLPNTVTFTPLTSTTMPMFGMCTRSFV